MQNKPSSSAPAATASVAFRSSPRPSSLFIFLAACTIVSAALLLLLLLLLRCSFARRAAFSVVASSEATSSVADRSTGLSTYTAAASMPWSFCIKNDQFCIQNDELCIQNDNFVLVAARADLLVALQLHLIEMQPEHCRARRRIRERDIDPFLQPSSQRLIQIPRAISRSEHHHLHFEIIVKNIHRFGYKIHHF